MAGLLRRIGGAWHLNVYSKLTKRLLFVLTGCSLPNMIRLRNPILGPPFAW